MNGCAIPDASRIRDKTAERVVLAGLLREGRVLLGELRLTRGQFYYDQHGLLFDLCCYACYGGEGGAILADVYQEARNRHVTEDVSVEFLVDVWSTDPWFETISEWAEIADLKSSLWVWCAVAAAAKVEHLAARRSAVYAASEMIREALNPSGGTGDINARTDDSAREEY